MPSDLMTTDGTIDPSLVQNKQIKVKRVSNTNNIGARVWYVIQADDGNVFQRWSLIMNPTDEVLSLVKPGDDIVIDYYVEEVRDDVFKRSLPFERNNIINASFVDETA